MTDLKKYAAKLLFQWRVEIDGVSDKMRTCEIRIITLEEKSAQHALSKAKEEARKSEFVAPNEVYSDEHNCDCYQHFEFIGVLDLLHLGIEADENEVWYDVKKMLNPMERKSDLIPSEEGLNAIVLEE